MNGTMRVLAVGDLAPECIARLEEDGLLVEARPAWGEAELAGGVDGYQALVAGPGVPVTAAVLAGGTRLRVVGAAGAGVDGIDVAAATRRGIVVVHAPDAGLVSEAEHALALVLACARDLSGADAALRRGDAARRTGDGVEVRGKTLGIIGVRPSSALLVERARALGMTVLACEPQAGAAAVGAVECIAPELVLAQADVLVVQTPSEAALFGAGELAQLKPGARLISPCSPAPSTSTRSRLRWLRGPSQAQRWPSRRARRCRPQSSPRHTCCSRARPTRRPSTRAAAPGSPSQSRSPRS